MDFTYAVCPNCKAINKLTLESTKSKKPVCGKCHKDLNLHGLISEVSMEDFNRVLKVSGDKPVVVDFWASWCGPCQSYGPEFQKASTAQTGAVFLKVNTESEQMLSAQYNVRGIPCTILFKNGRESKRQAGAMSADQLKSWITSP
jgi:thioredoxin 2